MSIQSPMGTLDIKNATLRVGKLEVSNIQGIDTALNVTRANSVLIYDDQASTTTFNGTTSTVGVRDTGNGYLDVADGYVYWGQKLPNSWVMDFEMDIRSGTNAGPLYANVFSTTNTGGDGYSFVFNDSNDKITLKYDGTTLTETTVSGLFTASEDWQKVVINYERGLIVISLGGSRKFYYKDIERETPYVNGEYISFSSASSDGRKIRDLRIVNGEKWVYAGESNVVYSQGSVGVGVTDPTAELDVSGTVKATTLEGDGSAITNISSANVGDFASNVTRIGTLETDLSDNSSRIGVLETDLSDNSSRIGVLETDLSDNSSRIGVLETDLSDNSSRITALETGNMSISGDKTFTGDIIFESNIHMNGGNVLVANTVNMTVSDPIIELGSNNIGANDLGIIMTRPAANSNVALVYDESADILRMGYTLNGANDSIVDLDSNALAVSVQGALSAASVSGDGSGLTSLNASNITTGALSTTTVTIDDYLIHDGDTDTKVGFPANDTFTVTTANSERIRVDSSGNVGIGTVSPGYLLDVHGAANVGTLTTTGRLGLGTATPLTPLHISSTNEITSSPAGSAVSQMRYGSTNSTVLFGVSSTAGHISAYDTSNFSTHRNLCLNADGGNVGIGTNSPIAALDIDGGANDDTTPALAIRGGLYDTSDLYVLNSYSVNTGVGYGAKVIGVNIKNKVETNNSVQIRNNVGGITSAGAIYLGSDDVNQGIFGVLGGTGTVGSTLAEYLTVKGNGNVGIGTTSPLDKLMVMNGTIRSHDSGNTTNIPGLKIRRRLAAVGQSGSNYIECGQFNDVGNDGSGTDGNRFIVKNDGNVGIGTTNPDAVLDVDGLKTKFKYEYKYQDNWSSNNNQTFTIPVTGGNSRGLMLVEAKVIQVAANSSSERVARVKGMISNYHTGNFYMTVIEGENVSVFETYMVGTSGSATGTFTLKYRPQEGYLQNVNCRLYLKIWYGGVTSSFGALSRTDTGSNTALTAPTFNSTVTTFGGNVGIGTTSPNRQLQIYGDSSNYFSFSPAEADDTSIVDNTNFGATSFRKQMMMRLNNRTWYWGIVNNASNYLGLGADGGGGNDPDIQCVFQNDGTFWTKNIRTSGNVGIGTTSPLGNLHVRGENVYLQSALVSNCTWRIMPQTGNTTKLFRIYDQDNATDRLVIDASGNVGIGTTSPNTKFYVESGVGDICRFFRPTSTSGQPATIHLGRNAATNDCAQFRYVYGGSTNNSSSRIDLGFYGNGSILNVTANDRVGIGLTSPAFTLDVNGVSRSRGVCVNSGFGNNTARPALSSGSTHPSYEIRSIGGNGNVGSTGADDGFLRLRAGGGTGTNSASYIDLSGYSVYSGNDMRRNIVFGTLGTERMRIKENGNVGIGTNNPGGNLEVAYKSASSLADGTIRIGNYSTTSTYGDNIYSLRWSSQLGMGPYSTAKGIWSRQGIALHVDANEEYSVKSSGWSNLFGVKGGSGDVYVRGNVGIGTASPGAKLDVVTSSSTPALWLRNSTSGSGCVINMTDSSDSSQFGTLTYLHVDGSSLGSGNRLHFGTNQASSVFSVEGTLMIGVAGKDNGYMTNSGGSGRKNLFIQSTYNGNTSQNYGWWIGAQNQGLSSSDNDLYFAVVRNGTLKLSAVIIDQNNSQMNFTGQHRTFVKGVPTQQLEDKEGLIVSADQNDFIRMSGGIARGNEAITTNESLPIVSFSTKSNDKKCFGVISTTEDPENRVEVYGNFKSNMHKELGDTRVYINSVGEGAVWVTDINGPLESGDYITTSNVAGYGMRQEDDILHNYTVAKITMDCDFNPRTQPKKIIKKELANVDYWIDYATSEIKQEEYETLPENEREIREDKYYKIYKREIQKTNPENDNFVLEVREELVNVLDEHGQLQWEDDPSGATEKAYKIRYLDTDGNITDEANAVHIAAFVGCTYHCG